MINIYSYDELRKSKHRLSLLLFLLLNIALSIFYVLNTLNKSASATLPSVLVAIFCGIALIVCNFKLKSYAHELNFFAVCIGMLWAWHINIRFHSIVAVNSDFLLYSLMMIFFISAISLTDNFIAFCLHSLPSALTVVVLDDFAHILTLLFTIALPLLSFSLHNLMQKRSEAFTSDLVKRLSDEREKFSDLSMIDPLTGLYNRRGLYNRLDNLPGDQKFRHYILLLDIDHFKAYNDNYGHTMGDSALVAVAVAIRDAVRSRDIVVRYGGEEFLVLLIDVDESSAIASAEAVRQAVLDLKIPHKFNDKVSTNVTLSAGIAVMSDNDIDASLRAADTALYLAKNHGRNSIEIAHYKADRQIILSAKS
ncbi:diguanylate cyclase [Sodalis sp. dw_96]|uniref:GGDEF domain-containing protein n=1 Tax=Sodalis sp. dw_96 TaxID=2719794 RepID=UPI001BD613CB|nr:diguanylate cyclase [Sodalis sp. dw_96]